MATFQFSEKVKIHIPELRLMESEKPLVLLGTDFMRSNNHDGWRFLNIGYHPKSRRGNVQFIHGGTEELQDVELPWAPSQRDFGSPPDMVMMVRDRGSGCCGGSVGG